MALNQIVIDLLKKHGGGSLTTLTKEMGSNRLATVSNMLSRDIVDDNMLQAISRLTGLQIEEIQNELKKPYEVTTPTLTEAEIKEFKISELQQEIDFLKQQIENEKSLNEMVHNAYKERIKNMEKDILSRDKIISDYEKIVADKDKLIESNGTFLLQLQEYIKMVKK